MGRLSRRAVAGLASGWLAAGLALLGGMGWAQSTASRTDPVDAFSLVEVEGTVEYRPAGNTNWVAAKPNQTLRPGDGLRTGQRSRMAVRIGKSIIRKSELTTVEIQSPPAGTTKPTLDVKSGLLYFFSRDRPQEIQLRTPTAVGAIRGTEFNVAVGPDGSTVLSLIDGEVELGNELGRVRFRNGEQAKVEPGKAPATTAMLAADAVNIIQWCLYYPAVLAPEEIGLGSEDRQALGDSLAAYERGDLLSALEKYPPGREPSSDAERLYLSALLLSVGQVTPAQALLGAVSETASFNATPEKQRHRRLANALSLLIRAVKFDADSPLEPGRASDRGATELLAESYYWQAQSKLEQALAAAKTASERSPTFSFAWARVAELEFSFGRTAAAWRALEGSLRIAPRNAQALALKGFLLCAKSRYDEAGKAFEQAIQTDGALGNAWLGRGLTRVRRGDLEGGRADLQLAAALEPQRALLRSYLGKAFGEEHDFARAARELELAKRLDSKDPTGWLYSALLNRQQNRANAAVRDLEGSKGLNDNRSLFRSKLLLDQDQAVRGANLAAIYRDTGLTDVSVREAARAVNLDYANASAHLFLANSYDALRDPRQVSLRYETPWFNELLLANLLAPVGVGTLSQTISQQEYSRLFDRTRFGISSGTEYLSRGDWQTYGSQFGTVGNSSYAVDAVYRSQRGERVNADLDQVTLYAKYKQQLTPQDSLFLQVITYRNDSGDVRQVYNPQDIGEYSRTLRFAERQDANLYAGWHREWSPNSHTLLLAARLEDEVKWNDPGTRVLTLQKNATGQTTKALGLRFGQEYRSDFEAYSTELQHIWQSADHTVVAGGRFQSGQADTFSKLIRNPQDLPPTLFNTANPADSFAAKANSTDLERISFYGYEQWQIIDGLRLVGGLSYERLRFPQNIDLPPIIDDQRTEDQLSPKAGLIWTPFQDTHFRGVYSRSLGGIYYDTSVRLEPTQVAGFNQAFRNVAPESVADVMPGARVETWGLGIDQKLKTGTYLGIEGEILNSDGWRRQGVFDFYQRPAVSSSIRENLDYTEKSLTLTMNQLLGQEWAMGARYRWSDAQLHDWLPEVPITVFPAGQSRQQATLHQLRLYLLFNHASGWFAESDTVWNLQSNRGYEDRPASDFWQLNAFAGYRFRARVAELSAGVLNLTDRDYRLNPLNLHPDVPRERTLVVRFKFNF